MPDLESLPVAGPPSKGAAPTPKNIAKLEAWLNAITAYGAYTTDRPWIFYEELDKYLGPWGKDGYLIAYGKKYCVLFSQDEKLNKSPVGRDWVRRTLLLLQDAIKKLVMERFRAHKLDSLSKEELQKVAFESHADAYTQGGLTLVAMLSPFLVAYVATIPIEEFAPYKKTAGASWKQVFETGGIAVPQAVALFFSAMMPMHSGSMARAHREDVSQFEQVMRFSEALRDLNHSLEAGRLDHVGTLDRLVTILAGTRWPDDDLAEAARDTIGRLRTRQNWLIQRYQREITIDPKLDPIYRSFDQRAF